MYAFTVEPLVSYVYSSSSVIGGSLVSMWQTFLMVETVFFSLTSQDRPHQNYVFIYYIFSCSITVLYFHIISSWTLNCHILDLLLRVCFKWKLPAHIKSHNQKGLKWWYRVNSLNSGDKNCLKVPEFQRWGRIG